MSFGVALRKRALVLFAFFLPLSSFAEIRLVCESSGADEYYNLRRTVVLTGTDQLLKKRSGYVISETWSEEEVHFTSTKKLASGTGYDDPNSFFPAFRAWTGTTTQALRQSLEPQSASPRPEPWESPPG